jgi:hypothetical protein
MRRSGWLESWGEEVPDDLSSPHGGMAMDDTSTLPVVCGRRRNRHALDGIITALRAAGHEFVIPKKLTCTAGRHAMIH